MGYNPQLTQMIADFKLVEFDRFKHEAGLNDFELGYQKWVTATNGSR